ncbi:helix-turn-helix transcriptional regulator [Paractinoplanes atraurantiacus]|uniref:Regulatory protein, luxR family n=1 Tax=Paractinoplanes atraurantiacus TaxID=1036182 RepID=A0A285K0C3_9ACTN|nr:LuxR C-terminal-related transcriptional regulator [Actinoplanes atraurantiacus]SNY66039.1 regulatory protein, luxR family [Actinoplanes atraurantiacus]
MDQVVVIEAETTENRASAAADVAGVAEAAGYRRLACRGVPGGQMPAYAGLGQLLESLLPGDPPPAKEAAPSADRSGKAALSAEQPGKAAWSADRPGKAAPSAEPPRQATPNAQPPREAVEEGRLPVGRLRALEAALGGDAGADRLLVGLAVRSLLTERGERLLLVAEDCQWLDRPTVDVLCFVGRRLTDLPIALVATVHPEEQSPAMRGLPAERLRPATRPPQTGHQWGLLADAGRDMPLSEVMTAAGHLGIAAEDWAAHDRADHDQADHDRADNDRHRPVGAAHGDAAELRRIHLALSRVASDPGVAARHRSAASCGRTEAEAADLERAGRRALTGGAQAAAAVAFRRAAGASPRAEDRIRRLALAAGAARAAGLPERSRALLGEALPLASDSRTIAELATNQLLLDLTAGLPGRSIGEFEALAARLEGDDRVRVLWGAAVHCRARHLPPHQCRRIEGRLRSIRSSSPLRTIALAMLAPGHGAAEHRARLPLLVAQIADDPLALLSLGIAAESVQDLPTAQTAWALSRDLFRRVGSASDECQSLRGLAALRIACGELAAGLADAEQALRIAESVGATQVMGIAAATVARAQVWLGRGADARNILERHAGLWEDQPIAISAAEMRWASGLLALTERRYRDAWAELNRVRRHRARAAWSVADLTEAAIHCGEEVAAARIVEATAAATTTSGHLAMLVERSRALLSKDDDGAQAHFELSLAEGEDAGTPLELARTRLLYGRWLRRRKRAEDAKDQLTEALQAFADARARPWAAEATAELRAAGETVRPNREARASLSPQEVRIATLAARGLTNKEIGEMLVVSPRTIGASLYRIFPQLGIAKRAQLREALSAGRERPPVRPGP